MSYAAVTFDSHGVRCHAWHFRAESDRMTGPHGRAMVVMAHGFGGTKDSGLEPFAERFAAGRDRAAQRADCPVVDGHRRGQQGVRRPRQGAKLMPLVAYPGERGALALDGAYESYTALAGPTWRNEVDSAVGLELGGIRATPAAKRLKCRLLVQLGDFDRYVPAASVVKTAVAGRGEVHHYPCDHFDVWPGNEWFD
ncbi:MAG: uncharacterized protein QOH27_5684 [Mycobacterium sp.]|jgi:pimeloyl-ACP methyl ester carboxylesterase|nr:uncharacterized protein [Mycobacterium sp.]